jgi:WD40 repeat protein
VFAGSEDSTVHVWNADTGEQLAIYSGLQFYRGASGVDYHPFEHMVAFASHVNSSCVVVCDYEKLDSGEDIGLQIFAMQDTILQSTVGGFTESHLKSSTPLHFGLSSLKEKKKKLVPLSGSEIDVLQGSPLAADRNGLSLSPNSMNDPSAFIEEDDKSSRVRLASIIEKMDQVLSRTPSKSSQQISVSFSRSFDPKLSDSSSSKTEKLGCFFHRNAKRET